MTPCTPPMSPHVPWLLLAPPRSPYSPPVPQTLPVPHLGEITGMPGGSEHQGAPRGWCWGGSAPFRALGAFPGPPSPAGPVGGRGRRTQRGGCAISGPPTARETSGGRRGRAGPGRAGPGGTRGDTTPGGLGDAEVTPGVPRMGAEWGGGTWGQRGGGTRCCACTFPVPPAPIPSAHSQSLPSQCPQCPPHTHGSDSGLVPLPPPPPAPRGRGAPGPDPGDTEGSGGDDDDDDTAGTPALGRGRALALGTRMGTGTPPALQPLSC